jgi:type III secretion protein Q
MERAAWGYLLLEAILACRTSTFIRSQLAPRLLSIHDYREEFSSRLPKALWLSVDLGLRFDAIEGTARLHAPAHALQAALEQVPSTAPAPASSGELAPVCLDLSVTAACCLPVADWARLSPGDVAVVEGLSGNATAWTGPVSLLSSCFEIEGALDAGRFSFKRARRRASPKEPLVALSSDEVTCTLPVELQVELGTVQVPIGTLNSLQPGAVVSLHVNPASPVSLKLGSRTVARAELVDIDGAIGARILTVLP